MIKRYKAILSVLLVILVAFTVVTVTGVIDINKMVTEKEKENEIPKNTYEDIFTTYTAAGLPLLKTDIENVFYTMSTHGDVAFFEIADGKVANIPLTGTKNMSVSCSGQTLTAQVHYIEKDGRTMGYGLFTNDLHPEVFLYDYAFFKLTNQFSAYKSKSDLLLLIDVEKERFYDEDKVYSESFYVSSDDKTSYFLNEDQRIVDLSARLRTDYKMFTDDILHQEESKIMFFSSRFYNDYAYSDNVDIFLSGGSGENVDNNRYIQNIASLDFWKTDEGVLYFVNVEDSTENTDEQTVPSAFTLNLFDGEESKEIKLFDGSLQEDYILSGSFLLNKATGDVYDIINDKSFNIDYEKFETSFTPDLFTVSENGKYCIIRGKNNLEKPSIGVLDAEKNEFFTFTDNVFGYVASMQALNDGSIAISLAAGENSETYYQLVYSCTGEISSEEGTSEETTVISVG